MQCGTRRRNKKVERIQYLVSLQTLLYRNRGRTNVALSRAATTTALHTCKMKTHLGTDEFEK